MPGAQSGRQESTSARAAASAVRQAAAFCRAQVHARMEGKMAELHASERSVLGIAEPEEVSA